VFLKLRYGCGLTVVIAQFVRHAVHDHTWTLARAFAIKGVGDRPAAGNLDRRVRSAQLSTAPQNLRPAVG
jgi:hypothetical protein